MPVKEEIMKLVHTAFLFMLLLSALNAQSGGGFEITEAVIAPAGGPAANGIFDADLTIGQPIADASASGNFSVTSGFWNFTPLGPTAASISISGRVLNGAGAGVANAMVYLQTQDGDLLSTKTTSFGHYRFANVLPGQAVLISVQSRRFTFAPRTVFAVDEITGLDLIPEP